MKFEINLKNKKILITGNTGFTGSWASLWFHLIGVDIKGFSLLQNTSPSMYFELGLNKIIHTTFGDISNFDEIFNCINTYEPDLILHLAAQPLVRYSYLNPLQTYMSNTLGTLNVLEASRLVKSVRGVVCITTDKVYENNDWLWPYRENDKLGGSDPYSSSKSAAEMIIKGYSKLKKESNEEIKLFIARGGNIIGGGDWSEDRLIPDFVRSLINKSPLLIRYPNAVRPWQHVLSLIQAYVMLLSKIIDKDDNLPLAMNFGPHDIVQYTVQDVISILSSNWSKPELQYIIPNLAEANTLLLDSTIARNELGWYSSWSLEKSLYNTVTWYKKYYENQKNALKLSIDQIENWKSSYINP